MSKNRKNLPEGSKNGGFLEMGLFADQLGDLENGIFLQRIHDSKSATSRPGSAVGKNPAHRTESVSTSMSRGFDDWLNHG